jgi:hypothetical protein
VTTFLVVAFLAVHGLLHLAVWLPKPQPAPAKPPPFQPDHSGVLTAVHVPERTTHVVAIGLASGTCAAYLLAAVATALGASWAVATAVAAALLGLLLKGLYFHPWLSVGVLLDLGVLSAALLEWPVALV